MKAAGRSRSSGARRSRRAPPPHGAAGPALAAFWTGVCAAFCIAAAPLGAQQLATADSVRVGEFDFGKMWTFESPPAEYFSDTYGFTADAEWFERARLPALRVPGCSASFVSPNGLVVTNHHCARGEISAVSREGERLLDEGFYATSLAEERPLPDYYADQLIAVRDVSDEVLSRLDAASPEQRSTVREQVSGEIEERLGREHASQGPVHVEVVPLYHGGRYSAYVFRRFSDVRLVAAAELELGFFGGDPDNFTYPRYALDFAFYRIYDEQGRPFRPEVWYSWGEGVEEGDVVFVIGNPGPTNRLLTVAQLEYQRDVFVPVRRDFFDTRLAALWEAYRRDPVLGEELDLRNQAFSLSNSLKAYTGRLDALRDPDIMSRKAAAEREFGAAVAADPALASSYGDLVERIAGLQERKRELAREQGAFYLLGNPSFDSRALRRAFLAQGLVAARQRGAPADTLAAMRTALLQLPDHPPGLEERLLGLRLADLERHLGADDPVVHAALGGAGPEAAARTLLQRSVFAERSRLEGALSGELPAGDPVLALADAIRPRVASHDRQAAGQAAEEEELNANLGRARFALHGTRVPPDATFSPRITDGVVRPYSYNGTLAPPYTTLFGLYDRHHAFPNNPDWALPERWLPPPAELDLSTPLNFISTADTYGGNSGSPAVTKELAIVGLNFDRNMEGLSRDFIYLPERGRNIMVDVRAIREALDHVYDADRIVLELLTGQLAETEAEADRARR